MKTMFRTGHFLVLLGFALLAPACTQADPGMLPVEKIQIEKADGAKVTINAEMATFPAQQAKGLMDRNYMPEDAGMLFLFPEEEPQSFWMKNTLIPLDMLFIDAKGVVNHIHPNAVPLDLTPVASEKPAKAVLELNGGASERMGIKEGDKVIYSAFGNKLAQ